jgi:hypothetical protein
VRQGSHGRYDESLICFMKLREFVSPEGFHDGGLLPAGESSCGTADRRGGGSHPRKRRIRYRFHHGVAGLLKCLLCVAAVVEIKLPVHE